MVLEPFGTIRELFGRTIREEVFRETIINAIVHRDYDIEGAQIQVVISNDQIIVKSLGAPVSPITFESFKSFNAPTLSRNPRAMFIFEQLKLVEQRGFGFKEIKNLPVKYHLSLPEITFEAPYLVLAFNRKAEDVTVAKIVNLSEEEQIGLEWIRSQKSVSRKQYAEKFLFDEKKALRHLQKFKKLTLVKDNGEKPSSNKFRYIIED
jgi:ATP-dependent DNA helicase RecG